jgi:hypothetical protein
MGKMQSCVTCFSHKALNIYLNRSIDWVNNRNTVDLCTGSFRSESEPSVLSQRLLLVYTQSLSMGIVRLRL